jgi:hypothetical protein
MSDTDIEYTEGPPSDALCRHYAPADDCTTCLLLCNCVHRCDEHEPRDGLSGACKPRDGSVCLCLEFTLVIGLGASTLA